MITDHESVFWIARCRASWAVRMRMLFDNWINPCSLSIASLLTNTFFDPSSDLTSFISLNVYDTSVGPGAWMGIRFMTRGDQLVVLKKGDPWLLLAVALSPFYSLLVILNLLNKNDLLRLKWRISWNMSERVWTLPCGMRLFRTMKTSMRLDTNQEKRFSCLLLMRLVRWPKLGLPDLSLVLPRGTRGPHSGSTRQTVRPLVQPDTALFRVGWARSTGGQSYHRRPIGTCQTFQSCCLGAHWGTRLLANAGRCATGWPSKRSLRWFVPAGSRRTTISSGQSSPEPTVRLWILLPAGCNARAPTV